jgi:hypothetical protein
VHLRFIPNYFVSSVPTLSQQFLLPFVEHNLTIVAEGSEAMLKLPTSGTGKTTRRGTIEVHVSTGMSILSVLYVNKSHTYILYIFNATVMQ